MYEIFEQLAQSRGVSNYAVAKATGISQTTLSEWKRGIGTPKYDKLEKIADFFNVSVDFLLGKEKPVPDGWIPVLGRVAAGIPNDAVEDIVDMEQLAPGTDMSYEYRGLIIHGHSMEPVIHDGAVVIVRIQDDVEDGDIAVVFIGDEATCKRIKKTPEGVFLMSLNPSYDPIFVSNAEIEREPLRVFGRVMEARNKF